MSYVVKLDNFYLESVGLRGGCLRVTWRIHRKEAFRFDDTDKHEALQVARMLSLKDDLQPVRVVRLVERGEGKARG